jgi:hypothetical protein
VEERLKTHRLTFHPANVPAAVEAVTVRWGRVAGGRLMLRFRIDGCRQVRLPPPEQPGRADELWKATCFELFLAGEGGCYREFNFSPSGQWAAYRFAGYRHRTGDFDPIAVPEIKLDSGASVLTFTVFLDERELECATHASLTAVIEEAGGRISYWADRHPAEKPDFHNPACFVLPLPASG